MVARAAGVGSRACVASRLDRAPHVAALAPPRPPPRPRRQAGRVRRLGDAAGVLRRRPQGARRGPRGRRDLRRQPPRQGARPGPGAADFVNATLTNDLGRIGPGQAQYTLCCDEDSGGVVDDLIAYLHADDRVLLVPNAANSAEVARRLRRPRPRTACSVDGPAHRPRRARRPGHRRRTRCSTGRACRPGTTTCPSRSPTYAGAEITVCRTGYTGERGYELVVPCGRRRRGVGRAARAAGGRRLGLQPCGLGARDTLRTEMGYPLHGQDISLDVTPVQARLGWAVGWGKPAFWGKDVLRGRRRPGRCAAARARSRRSGHPAARHAGAARGRRPGRRGHLRHVLARRCAPGSGWRWSPRR